MKRLSLAALLFASACAPSSPSPASSSSNNNGMIPYVAHVTLPARDHTSGHVAGTDIIGGTNDTTDTSVVLVIAQPANSQEVSLCSGEVVSNHVVLTAAHCVDPATVGNGNQFSIFLGNDINDQSQATDNSNFLDVTSTDFDSAFDPNQLQGGHDVGVVVASTVIPRTHLTVNTTTLSDSNVGDTLRLVGFGESSATQSSSGSQTAGTRRQTTSQIAQVADGFIAFGSATHNTCEGDSGGPQFDTINGVEVIASITSFGDQQCTQTAGTRVDEYWTSFISPHIQAADPGTTSGSNPDGGTTTTTTTTGTADGGTTTTTTTTGSSTGNAVGTSCTDSSQCASGICTNGGSRYCTQSCDLTNANSCPANTHCATVSGAPYCVVTQHGCSAGATTPSSGGALPTVALLLLVCGALVRRRFRHA